jgi:uncharacterized RDD family membrane protein YckC
MSENWTPPYSPQPPEMNYALWVDRVLAAVLDGVIALLVMFVLYFLLFVIGGVGSALIGAGEAAVSNTGEPGPLSGLLGCSTCCLFFILPPVSYLAAGLLNKVYLVSKRGYSVGQGLMKLRVVDAHGNLISTGTAVLRLLCTVGLGFVPVVGGALDLLWPLWDPQRQTLHDKAVGTFVIKTG